MNTRQPVVAVTVKVWFSLQGRVMEPLGISSEALCKSLSLSLGLDHLLENGDGNTLQYLSQDWEDETDTITIWWVLAMCKALC